YHPTVDNSTALTIDHSRVQTSSTSGAGYGGVFYDGGTLQYTGQTTVLPITSGIDSIGDGVTLEIPTAATVLTFQGGFGGDGALTKSGPGVLVLDQPANLYVGGITIANGRIDVSTDSRLGIANPTVNPLGTLRYTASTSSSRSFNLLGGVLEAPSGVTLTLNGASVGGGFLRGLGTFALTGNTSIAGSTSLSSTTINQSGPASLINFTNNGLLTNVAAQSLAWNGGTNTSAGRVTVNGTANVNDFVNDGQLAIPAGGALNNSVSSLVLGGGSTTTVGTPASHGGAINLGGQSLELRGGLLANNGTI